MISLYDEFETNFNHIGISLKDTISAKVVEEANGMFELEMEYPRDKVKEIIERNIIKCNTHRGKQLFRIYRVIKTLQGLKIYARHITYDLLDNFIEDIRPTETSGSNAIKVILNNTQYPHNFNGSSDIDNTATAYYIRKNPIQTLIGDEDNSFVNRWGGEIVRDNFDIRMKAQGGMNRGYEIRLGKNLVGIEEDIDTTEVVTRLYPTVVINQVVHALPEKYIDSENINKYRNPVVRETRIDLPQEYESLEEEQEINMEEIYDLMREHCKDLYEKGKIDEPHVNYKVDFVELSKTEQYKDLKLLEQVDLYDVIHVNVSELDIRVDAKVIKVVYDVLKDKYETLELGSFKNKLTDNSNKMKDYIDNEVSIVTSSMQKAINNATDIITGSKGGYKIDRFNAEGKPYETLYMDTDDIQTAKNVLRINKDGIGFSNDGYNGEFGTAMTIDGKIVADYITSGTLDAGIIKTGLLQGGKVRFDLTNGTLFIGDSPDDYVLLFDGQDLHLSGDFRTYQDGYLATELKGNSYMFYDWEGRTTDSMNVGAFSVSRRYGDIDKPGMRINHRKEGHFSIMHLTDTGYSAYVDFDAQNNLGSAFPNYPIKFKEPTMFYYDTKIDNARNLFFGDQGRIVEQANGGFRIEFNGGLGKGLRIITSGGTPILDYPNDNYEIWLRRKTFVNGDFRVSGSKNAVVKTEHYGERLLNSLETPESYFQDKGSGKTSKDGYCYIHTDDIFDETVNTDMQYHVEIQEYGEGTLRPIERNPRYFVVKGTPNLDFGWTLTAKRKGYEYHRLETPDSFEEEEETNIDYLIENEEEKQANEELKNIVEKELTFDLADYVLGGE